MRSIAATLIAGLVGAGDARAASRPRRHRDRRRRPRGAGAGAGRRACFRPGRRPRSCSTRWRPSCCIGWPRANRPEEREFLLPDVGSRPEVGRLTGRGNTANLEVVLALKPDLILDVGSVNATYVSLAERVQQQTGIPYALLDGRFDDTAAGLPHARRPDRPARGERGARALSPSRPSRPSPAASPACRASSARASTTRAGRAGSRPGSAARSTSRPSSSWRRNVAGEERAAGSPPSRSSRCCCGIPT